MSSFSTSLVLPGEGFQRLPELPSTHLPRSRLVELFLHSPRRLRLLCGPAGFGKTLLITEALHCAASPRHLWLRLNGKPLNLAEFTVRIAEELGVERSQALRVLEHQAQPLWLILDDYPVQARSDLDDWLERLLMKPGTQLQVVVSSRQRPDWNLPRLLLDDQLLQLGTSQLAFTRDEFDALADALSPHLPVALRDEYWQHSLGWCAGSRLLLAQQQPDEAEVWLREYLEFELLPRLGEEEAALLFSLAHVPKFSAEVCEAMWEGGGAALFLRLLHGQSLFIPLGQAGWYRALPMVAQALQSRLSGAELNRLRLRACRALNAHGQVDEAIELALRAGQPEVAAAYMRSLGLDWLLTDNHLKLLLEWREKLPTDLLESTPRLICQNARALLLGWRLDEAQACLARLGNFLPQPSAELNRRLLAHWQALYGAVEGMRGNARVAREHCHGALATLRDSDWRATLLCCSTLGRIAMATGQADEARRLLETGIELARRQGCMASEVLLNCDRIRQALLAGEFGAAAELIDESRSLVENGGRRDSLQLGRLNLLQGELEFLRGALVAGESAMLAGLCHAREAADPFALHGYLGLVEVASARGDLVRARAYLAEAERQMHCANVEEACYQGAFRLHVMRLLARHNEWQQVLDIARRNGEQSSGATARLAPLHAPSLLQRNEFHLALAECATGQVSEGRLRLKALRRSCEQMRFLRLAREAQKALAWVEKVAIELRNSSAQEQPALNADLAQGLQSWLAQTPVAIERSLPGTRAEKSDATGCPLSARELEVLKLLAQGLSNDEVGTRLFISLNTVKTHTKKINTKLGVQRRTQAIMQAKALGILA
ncbi:ATP-dependent transcriptional regulator [Pseudomonas sp. UL073]|uniref:ATP-dependent transcriptional regulator n=1 Tax=Zestomonas insulae TaxID=2809017 RepID=A0ABS2IIW1_9GAMM|nr:LuxR C-terminal-related transcriptional regulator [Pseudomonas insulae]MBM7061880.1 ATP-dependent transcriptional regulator [Pseudomonas insulae]